MLDALSINGNYTTGAEPMRHFTPLLLSGLLLCQPALAAEPRGLALLDVNSLAGWDRNPSDRRQHAGGVLQ
jgi:hypothetical protein